MTTDDSPTLDQLIRDHAETRDRLQSTIDRAQMDLRRVETELEMLVRLKSERANSRESVGQGRLTGIAQKVGRGAVAAVDAMSQVSAMRSLDRVAAIERVLDMTDVPLSPTEIEQRLRSFGRDDEYDSISAALAHLKRSGRAHTPRRGEWVAGPRSIGAAAIGRPSRPVPNSRDTDSIGRRPGEARVVRQADGSVPRTITQRKEVKKNHDN